MLRDMRPDLAPDDGGYERFGNQKSSSNYALEFSVCASRPYLNYLPLGKLCARAVLAAFGNRVDAIAPLPEHVPVVFRDGSKREVSGVAARRVIASVHHDSASERTVINTVRKSERQTVREKHTFSSTAALQFTIPGSGNTSCPRPAFMRETHLDLPGESLNKSQTLALAGQAVLGESASVSRKELRTERLFFPAAGADAKRFAQGAARAAKTRARSLLPELGEVLDRSPLAIPYGISVIFVEAIIPSVVDVLAGRDARA